MTLRRKFAKWVVVLVGLHAIVAAAGFLAPYDPVEQDRERPYLPPMHIHMMDPQGHFHLRPFFHLLRLREGSFDQYEEDATHVVPLHFFARGAAYRLLGVVPSRLHLSSALQVPESISSAATPMAAINSLAFSTAGKFPFSPVFSAPESPSSSAR